MEAANELLRPSEFVASFPDWVSLESRPGYDGLRVKPEGLLQVATSLRDQFHYDYLATLTAVDYPADDILEVVYHFFRSSGGPAIVLHVGVPREDPRVPSLTPLFPGVEFQEREAWDLLGVSFEGHPDLRRILTWEGFNGHPLRKDWHEAYYEQDGKPFDSRWPSGAADRAEDRTPYHANLSFPEGFDPQMWEEEEDDAVYQALQKEADRLPSSLGTEPLILNFGPQHPSTHGVLRVATLLDGERILALKPVMGYLHRNHEKIGERNTFQQNMPFTDRLDYITSMSNNFGYALAVEKLMGVQPTERAEYLRVIMAELTRIESHIMFIGFLLNDLGAIYTPSLYALEERELILDIFEAVSGSRMMCNYFRFGGVVRDIPPEVMPELNGLVFDRLPRKIDEIDRYLTTNEIVRARCEGMGVLDPQKALAYSASGPVLRASGIPYDIRRAEPYSIYEQFDFDVACRNHGDTYDRYLIRLDEMRQSVRILQQALKSLPSGPVQSVKPQYQVRVPAGEAYGRVESPKGELGYYVVSNGKPNPWRYHIRTPSFVNLTVLDALCRGEKVADLIAILGSIDIVMGEVDR
jgi:NADH:ubiquinone oxidoreductase subunit D/NADH:ubiquinone oxidoreductase subunit C